MSFYISMSKSTEFFACRVHDLQVEILKRIQTNNEQYKVQV